MELNKQLLNYKNQTIYEVGLEREYKIFKIETLYLKLNLQILCCLRSRVGPFLPNFNQS